MGQARSRGVTLALIAVLVAVGVVTWGGETDPSRVGPHMIIGDAVSQDVAAGEAVVIVHDSGARIEVPSGALTGLATLFIAEVEPPDGTLAVPNAYYFSVSGADLLSPVTVFIPIESRWLEDPASIHALHWNDELGEWEPVAGSVDESLQAVAVTTDDLSLFTAVAVKVEATCSVDPATAQTGKRRQPIKFSADVRAIETPLNIDIKVYMRPSITTTVQGGTVRDARKADRRLAWERLARSLLHCVCCSHRSSSAGPNRSLGSISLTTR